MPELMRQPEIIEQFFFISGTFFGIRFLFTQTLVADADAEMNILQVIFIVGIASVIYSFVRGALAQR